jgi:PAS domain S-box-containing protein
MDELAPGCSPGNGGEESGRSTSAERLRMFSRIARAVASEFDIEEVVQMVTDAATEWSGGKFGAFFYNVIDDTGEILSLYTLSGAPRSAFSGFEMPRKTMLFAPTFEGRGIVRSDDIRADPRYGKSAPHFGMPPGHLPVVSYLAVPVVSRTGEVLGGLFVGHDQPGIFTREAEEIVEAIAAHAAIAVDNARLFDQLRRESERRRLAHEMEARLAAIVENSEDAILSKDLNGTILSWNAGAERLFGYMAEESIGKPITMLIPEDRRHEEDQILFNIRAGKPAQYVDTIRRRKDGTLVHVSLSVSPVRNERGEVIGASKIARDISDRVRAQERQLLLLREMNHRIRNLFALVSGVINLSARSASTVGELAATASKRISALARAHELTLPDVGPTQSTERRTTLLALVEAIVAPHKVSDNQVAISGNDVPIEGGALTPLALLLHEFATNSAKYGALSSPTAKLEISVATDAETLQMRWIERGGPPITKPTGTGGFGAQLERNAIEGALQATIERDWGSTGLTINLRVPLQSLLA